MPDLWFFRRSHPTRRQSPSETKGVTHEASLLFCRSGHRLVTSQESDSRNVPFHPSLGDGIVQFIGRQISVPQGAKHLVSRCIPELDRHLCKFSVVGALRLIKVVNEATQLGDLCL